MTKYTVERGIPAPGTTPKSDGRKVGRPAVYPFTGMAVGDSFFVPSCDATSEVVSKAAWAHGTTFGKKFATRSVEGGTRCWRTSKVTKK